MSAGGRVYSFNELVLAARASDRSVRRFVQLGMPCRQVGKVAERKGEKSVPYIFGPEALEWIEQHRAEKAARGEGSPFTPILDPLDPRFDAAVAATRRIEIQIADVQSNFYFREAASAVNIAEKIVQREIFARVPGRVERAIAAIGDDTLNAVKIGKRVAGMIDEALENYSPEGIIAALPPEKPSPTIPDALDEDSDLDGDSDSEGLELARRYHKSDPRYRLTKLRTLLQALKNAIATGELIEKSQLRAEHNMAFSVVKSALSGIAARVVQPVTSDPILFRRLVGIVKQGIYEAYSEFDSPDTRANQIAILKGTDPLDVDFEPDPLDEPELDRLPKSEPELELELDEI